MKRMMCHSFPRIGLFFAASLVAVTLVVGARSLGAQAGTVSGRVMIGGSDTPVRAAQVVVVGTQLGAMTDGDGRFRIANVPAASRELNVKRIGFKPLTVPFTRDASGNATVAISLSEAALTLEATVITGSVGDTRVRAIGNAVATVKPAENVGSTAVANITEILQAKTPGLTLMPGSGTVGTAANYRLRGAGSLYAGNTPVIYVDGVRVSARGMGAYDTFGQATSSLDAINPGDIESIEVIKGRRRLPCTAPRQRLASFRSSRRLVVLVRSTGKRASKAAVRTGTRIFGRSTMRSPRQRGWRTQ